MDMFAGTHFPLDIFEKCNIAEVLVLEGGLQLYTDICINARIYMYFKCKCYSFSYNQ